MSRFEYLSVLMSMIIALGLTEVMVGWGRVLQRRLEVKFSWLHAFWSFLTVFLMIQFWWGFWNFRVVEDWSLGRLLAVVLETMTLVFCALQLVPRRRASGPVDLEEFYFSNARAFFILGAILMIQFCIGDSLMLGVPALHPENIIRGVGAVIAGILAWNLDPRLHKVMPLLAAALLGFFLFEAVML